MRRLLPLIATLYITALGLPATAQENDPYRNSNDPYKGSNEPARGEGAPPPVVNTGDPIMNFCLFGGLPPADAQYVQMREVKVKKGTYGSVREILPDLAQQARKIGADAIINYDGSQRFGLFIWRVVRPVVRGMAVKWLGPLPLNCDKMGGMTVGRIMETDLPPSKGQAIAVGSPGDKATE